MRYLLTALILLSLALAGEDKDLEQEMQALLKSTTELKTKSLLRKEYKPVKEDMCQLKSQSLRDAGSAALVDCSCIYECATTRRDIYHTKDSAGSITGYETGTNTEAVLEAMNFCLWANERLPDFREYQSQELRKTVQVHCRQIKCSKWYLEESEVSTIDLLTTRTPAAVVDTIKSCFPYMMMRYRDNPPECGYDGIECE